MMFDVLNFEEGMTKERLELVAQKIIQKAEAGEINALEYKIKCNAYKKLFDLIEKGLDEMANTEFEQYGKGELTKMLGAKISQKETGVRYNFSNTPIWVAQNKKVKAETDERKAIEDKLKILKRPTQELVDDELIELNPPSRSSTTKIIVEFE